MYRFFLLIASISVFSLTAKEISIPQVLTEAGFESFDGEDVADVALEFLEQDHDYQKETYKVCYDAAKRAWKIGERISREEYQADDGLRAKVKATALLTITFYERGMPAGKAARLAKRTVNSGLLQILS